VDTQQTQGSRVGPYNLQVMTDDDQFGEVRKRKILAEIMSKDSEHGIEEGHGAQSTLLQTREDGKFLTKANFQNKLLNTA
jgi:hypothetical protein